MVLLQSPGHVQGEVVFNHHLCFVGGSEFSPAAAASLHVGEGVDSYRVQWVWHNNRLQCDPQKRAGFVSISGIVRRFCGRLSRGVTTFPKTVQPFDTPPTVSRSGHSTDAGFLSQLPDLDFQKVKNRQ